MMRTKETIRIYNYYVKIINHDEFGNLNARGAICFCFSCF